ncbi:30S ribosome-binding factor RbfA [Candidatus Fermentibacteria bacterium]|nr:30S ribosome-binding factor RbfA [Candidatus Fermentibacteria bacterium]
MDHRRIARIREIIHREIASILEREISDPRLGFVTVTRVKLSSDCSHATIFFSTMGTDEERAETMEAVDSSHGYIRSLLADRIRLKTVPALSFVHDTSIEDGNRVLRLIRELNED